MNADSIKNEHIIYAYGEKMDGTGFVLIVGITDQGIDYLREKKTLLVNPPSEAFEKVTNVVIFHESDKATLKQRLRETGMAINETDLRRR